MKHKGQILLITVMLLATVMTIVLSVSFKSVTETQITKLEEENQKALAAAESAIEVALKENNDNNAITSVTIGSGSLNSITGFSGSATIESLSATTFTTPNIDKDRSYTFYLGTYDMTAKTIGASLAQAITVCFESGSPNPAIEVTLVKTSGVKKYVYDPSTRISANTPGGSSGCTPNDDYGYSYNIPGTDIGADDSQFLLVRVLYSSTRLLFSRATTLPVQGRTISSQATSNTSTGVSKKVVLFQSYPQIPGEFFTTSF